jgi:hypothetical protein
MDVNLYMPGAITIKGNLSFGGVQTGPPVFPMLPKGDPDEGCRYSANVDVTALQDRLAVSGFEGSPVKYEIRDEHGRVYGSGAIDNSGLGRRIYTEEPKKLKAYILDGEWSVFADLQHPILSDRTDSK